MVVELVDMVILQHKKRNSSNMKNCFFSKIIVIVLTVAFPHMLRAVTIETHVNSFGTYNFSGKHFCMLSNMENVSNDDVEFKEYAKYISYAFQMRGGIEVSPLSDSAEICILLGYDIKDASYIRTISEPVWGQTNVASVTARTNSLGTNYYYNYNYGVVSYKQSQQLVNKFNRYVDLFVYEMSPKDKGNQKMVWKAYAKSEGSMDNLFRVFPFMAFTLYNVIGKTTNDYWFRIPENNLFVDYFRKGELLKQQFTLNPNVDNGCQHTSYELGRDDYWLWLVSKQDFQTVVCLELYWGADDHDYDTRYMLYENTYISWKGKQYRCTKAENISNEKEIRLGKHSVAKSSKQQVYLFLVFPPLPEEADMIDIISQKKKERSSADIVWKGVQLRNW